MSGETDLATLLRSIRPVLDPEVYVFVTSTQETALTPKQILCTFREAEGVTLICERAYADANALTYDGTFRRVTLTVHSSLQAVGFLAAVSSALAQADIPCNAVSAFHHDHLFVPERHATRALQVMSGLACEQPTG